jgi:hypothetical protein
VVVVGSALLALASAATPVRADDFNKYFPQGITVSKDPLQNYTVEFTPNLKNGNTYELQVAGKKQVEVLGKDGKPIMDPKTCNPQVRYELAAIHFLCGYNQRVGITTVEGKFDAGSGKPSGGGGITAAVGQYYGGWHNRWAGDVTNEIHLRVRVSNQNNQTLYTTRWYGGDDIVNWPWPQNLSWVKEVKR